MGFDLHGRCVGIVGSGRIGTVFARIMAGFGCRLMAYDPYPNDEMRSLGARYVDLPELFAEADIIALHAPLTAATHHLVDRERLALVKPGVMIVNTSRGGLIDTEAAIEALKDGRIGYLGLDVYEEEDALGFFEDLSQDIIQDDTFARLLTFPNVLITAHQGFFTVEALQNIAEDDHRQYHGLRADRLARPRGHGRRGRLKTQGREGTMPGFEIRSVPRQDTAVIHLRCRPDAISATMGEAFGKVFAAIGQTGATPAGPVFSRYFEFGAEAVDFECGATVAAPFSG